MIRSLVLLITVSSAVAHASLVGNSCVLGFTVGEDSLDPETRRSYREIRGRLERNETDDPFFRTVFRTGAEAVMRFPYSLSLVSRLGKLPRPWVRAWSSLYSTLDTLPPLLLDHIVDARDHPELKASMAHCGGCKKADAGHTFTLRSLQEGEVIRGRHRFANRDGKLFYTFSKDSKVRSRPIHDSADLFRVYQDEISGGRHLFGRSVLIFADGQLLGSVKVPLDSSIDTYSFLALNNVIDTKGQLVLAAGGIYSPTKELLRRALEMAYPPEWITSVGPRHDIPALKRSEEIYELMLESPGKTNEFLARAPDLRLDVNGEALAFYPIRWLRKFNPDERSDLAHYSICTGACFRELVADLRKAALSRPILP